MIKNFFKLASPSGKDGKLTTLIFHRVLPIPDSIFPDESYATEFDKVISWVKNWFNVLPLDTAVHALKEGKLPPRAAAITFDDGYADNFSVALPILSKHGLPATFFIATGYLDGGRMWNDTIIESIRACREPSIDLRYCELGCWPIESPQAKRNAIEQIIRQLKYLSMTDRQDQANRVSEHIGLSLPDNLMMSSQHVRQLHKAGMQIGAHTASHPILAKVPIEIAKREIRQSKEKLESLLDSSIKLFAYPNGKPGEDYLPEHSKLVKELGFSAAFSTVWGAATADSDIFQLPRFTPWDKTKLKFGLRLFQNIRKTK